MAVYTNVTSDHLDRHGSLEAYRGRQAAARRAGRPGRGPRAERRGPGRRRRTPALGRRAAVALPARAPAAAAASAWSTAGSSRTVSSACALAGGGRRDRAATAGSCRSPSSRSPAPTTSRTRWPRRGRRCCSASRPTRSAAAAAAFARRRAPPRAGRRRSTASASSTTRRARSPTRSSRRCARSTPPIVLIAGGRDKGVDLSGLAAGRRRARRRGGADRRERPATSSATFRDGRASRAPSARATLEAAVASPTRIAREALAAGRAPARGPATVLLSPAAASFDMFVDYAARGAAFKAAVAALAAERAAGGTDEPRPADPAARPAAAATPSPIDGRGRAGRPTGRRSSDGRRGPPARAPPGRLRDPRRGRRARPRSAS